MYLENPESSKVRDIRFPELVYRASENGIDSLNHVMGKMEDEAISYLQNELGLEDFEGPKQGLVVEDALPAVEQAGGDHLGVHRDRDGLAAIKLNASFSKPFMTAVHEMVHLDQYQRMLNLDLGESQPQDVIAENGLGELNDLSEADMGETYEGTTFRRYPLVDDLIIEKDLSVSEIAKAIYEDPEVRSEIQDLHSEYNEVGENENQRFLRELNQDLGETESNEWNLEENKQALNVVNQAYDKIVSSLDDTHGEAFNSPETSGELEGFAHYVSATLDNNRFENRAGEIEDSYTTELENGSTVGEYAADRLRELGKIHQNLTEHANMDNKKASNYILTEVQPRKFDYAVK